MNFKEYLKQLSIVILGILVAFGVSNIGTHYQERSTQKQVLLTTLNEIKDNNDVINVTIKSLDTLHGIFTNLQAKKDTSAAIAINYTGLALKSIGYETAKYTGVLKDVDYKLTSRIVENYESQNTLETSESVVIDELYAIIKNKKDTGKNVDYLLFQILNLKNQLESFDVEQKELIEKLVVSLDLEG